MLATKAGAVVALYPRAANRYRQKIYDVHEALTRGDAASIEAVALVRDLISTIRLIPRKKDEPVALEIVADLAALMAPAHEAGDFTVSLVAGAGFEPTTFRL
jgi:hypothetical protein